MEQFPVHFVRPDCLITMALPAKDLTENYRPASLINIDGKVLRRIFASVRQLVWEKNNTL